MVRKLKEHEEYIKKILISNSPSTDWNFLSRYNKSNIGFFQHERLVHLMVTLAFALFLLISVFCTFITKMPELFALDALFLILLVPYIIHYYSLENGVQRLYWLDNQIEQHIEKSQEREESVCM